ncbi:MAG: selenide, water dikinase SelD [Cyanobacteria bacterium P01_H01_bin.121]
MLSPQPSPVTQDLVLLGGGHSHAIVLRLWGMQPLPGVRLTLISDRTHTPYSGMLPGHLAGYYDFDACHIDLRQLAQFAGAQYYCDRAVGLDLQHRKVLCANHPPVGFDWLSLDIGSQPGVAEIPGAREYAVPVKPVPAFLQYWQELLDALPQQKTQPLRLGIVGGGTGGVELALSLQARLQLLRQQQSQRKTWAAPEIHLFQRGAELMHGHNRRVRRYFRQILRQRGIQVHLDQAVCAVQSLADPSDQPEADSDIGTDISTGRNTDSNTYVVSCHTGLDVPCEHVFWVTNALAPSWLAESGLATDTRGFMLVSDTLQSISHPRILGAGDIATMVHHPRPKAGVFAVRQGQPLFENLQRLLTGRSPRLFQPQRQLLALIGDGQGRALASRGWLCLGPARWLWRWKDWIDQRFMARFQNFPVMQPAVIQPHALEQQGSELQDSKLQDSKQQTMQPQVIQSPAMHCKGCGSKVGSQTLTRVLQRLQTDQSHCKSVLKPLGQLDDAAVLPIPSPSALIQTVDFLLALVDDPFSFGQITANHCLNDLYAMGAQPHSALAIATIPYGAAAQQEESLYQLLAGGVQVLGAAGATLVGGHTTEGAELAFGLTCNGFCNEANLWRKGNLQPGQVLVLTKPLGIGTLFAAAMQGQAKGRWLDAAIDVMLQSNAIATEIFRKYEVTACTDITGFGVVGHLVEMLLASNISAQVHLDNLPVLPGVISILDQGIVSSLYSRNSQQKSWITLKGTMKSTEQANRLKLLFDPQTSGGLLAGVPEEQFEACIKALSASGYTESQVVGQTLNLPRLQRPTVEIILK